MLCLRTGQAVFKRGGLRVSDLQPGVATGFCVFSEQGVGLGFEEDADEAVSEGRGIEEAGC